VNALRLQPYQAGAARSAPTIIFFGAGDAHHGRREKPGTAHARPFEKTPHRDSASQKFRYEYRGSRVSVFLHILKFCYQSVSGRAVSCSKKLILFLIGGALIMVQLLIPNDILAAPRIGYDGITAVR